MHELVYTPIEAHVEALLRGHGVALSEWGESGRKSISDLAEEITHGETQLLTQEGGLVRSVNAATVNVLYEDHSGNKYRLREDRQEFPDGTVKRRPQLKSSLSEKIKGHESPIEAARGGVRDELSIISHLNLIPNGETVEERVSDSYPGLMSRYNLHNFNLAITSDLYNPEGYMEEKNGRKTYFVWDRVEGNRHLMAA